MGTKRVRLSAGYGSTYLSPSALRTFDQADRHDVLSRSEQSYQNFASQIDLRCDAAMDDVLRNIHNVSILIEIVSKRATGSRQPRSDGSSAMSFHSYRLSALMLQSQMLNCIVGMVEKTKRAVCALQRGQTLLPTSTLTALGEMPLWSGEMATESKKRPRDYVDPYGRNAMSMSFNNHTAGDLESRVSEVRKRAGTDRNSDAD